MNAIFYSGTCWQNSSTIPEALRNDGEELGTYISNESSIRHVRERERCESYWWRWWSVSHKKRSKQQTRLWRNCCDTPAKMQMTKSELEQKASNASSICDKKLFIGVTNGTKRELMKLSRGGMIPADCVGRSGTSQMTGIISCTVCTVCRWTSLRLLPNNGWCALKHSRRTLFRWDCPNVWWMSCPWCVLCCTHVLTDFFMHICCMAQDVEHPILSAVVTWENVATPAHRTNTFVKIEESDKENCGSGGGHKKKKPTDAWWQTTCGSGWWTTSETGTEECWSRTPEWLWLLPHERNLRTKSGMVVKTERKRQPKQSRGSLSVDKIHWEWEKKCSCPRN